MMENANMTRKAARLYLQEGHPRNAKIDGDYEKMDAKKHN
jgi:hypothetical protein